jgi:hypothetical protein
MRFGLGRFRTLHIGLGGKRSCKFISETSPPLTSMGRMSTTFSFFNIFQSVGPMCRHDGTCVGRLCKIRFPSLTRSRAPIDSAGEFENVLQ